MSTLSPATQPPAEATDPAELTKFESSVRLPRDVVRMLNEMVAADATTRSEVLATCIQEGWSRFVREGQLAHLVPAAGTPAGDPDPPAAGPQ